MCSKAFSGWPVRPKLPRCGLVARQFPDARHWMALGPCAAPMPSSPSAPIISMGASKIIGRRLEAVRIVRSGSGFSFKLALWRRLWAEICISVQSLANQLQIGFGEGQRTVLHHRKIIVVPPGFHDSFSGVVESSLQNVRHLMGNYMR